MNIFFCRDILSNIYYFLSFSEKINLLLTCKIIYYNLYEISNKLVFNIELIKNKIRKDRNICYYLEPDSYYITNYHVFYTKKNKSNIPCNIRKIIFSHDFNSDIGIDDYGILIDYPFLNSIIFGDNFDKPIGNDQVNFIPSTVSKIFFGKKFNQPLSNCMCCTFRHDHSYKCYNYIGEAVREIFFGEMFNQPLGNNFYYFLPENLVKIIFGNNFNQPIYSIGRNLPSKLKILVFGNNFNQRIGDTEDYHLYIESYLPLKLEILVFGKNFNFPIGINFKSYLPDTLKILTFGPGFKQPISNDYALYLPYTIEFLTISIDYIYKINEIPKTIKKINFIDDNGKIVQTICHKIFEKNIS